MFLGGNTPENTGTLILKSMFRQCSGACLAECFFLQFLLQGLEV